jgi:hypothetical protein
MNEESPAAPRSKWLSFQHPRLVISLLLIAGGLVLYAPIKNFSFVSVDDPQYIWLNMHVMAGLNAKSISWAFQSIHLFYWQPLTWLSHMLDVTLYGLNAAGHHFTSVFWHLLNGVLLFFRVGTGQRQALAERDGGGSVCGTSAQFGARHLGCRA